MLVCVLLNILYPGASFKKKLLNYSKWKNWPVFWNEMRFNHPKVVERIKPAAEVFGWSFRWSEIVRVEYACRYLRFAAAGSLLG